MSDNHCFKQLNNFLDVLGRSLEFDFSQLILNGKLKFTVVNEWHLDTWKQIVDDAFEERKIVL
jgi:hypothetical protein